MTTIPEGTVFFETQVGTYNFHYPNEDSRNKTTKDVEAEELHFIGAPKYRAFRVPRDLFPDVNSNIMWVRREDL